MTPDVLLDEAPLTVEQVVAAMSCLVPSYRLTDPADVARIGEHLVRESTAVYPAVPA